MVLPSDRQQHQKKGREKAMQGWDARHTYSGGLQVHFEAFARAPGSVRAVSCLGPGDLMVTPQFHNLKLTKHQMQYDRALRSDKMVVICAGPPGTGKTMLAVREGLRRLFSGRIDTLMFSRPATPHGKDLGFLPGSINDKIFPYIRPMFDLVDKLLGEKGAAERLQQNHKIRTISLELEAQGANFERCFCILDEAQHASWEQLRLLTTRPSDDNCKIVLCGDPTQVNDTRSAGSNGLHRLLKFVAGHPHSCCEAVEMGNGDIKRSKGAKQMQIVFQQAEKAELKRRQQRKQSQNRR